MTASSTNTLMLVGAHHDDNEGNAGATIARHKKAGWRVVSVVMTNGRWTRDTMSDENIAIRNQESRDAAKLLGMETAFLGFHEDDFLPTKEAFDALIARIIEYRPNVIVTHPPHDYSIDHMSTSKCALDASYACGPASAAAGGPIVVPRLYYCDAVFVPFEPDVYVDAGDYVDLKAQAQACHKSQLPSEGRGDGDIIDLAKTRARFRGFECGVKYAEAFRFVPKLAQTRMAELLE